MQPMEIVVPLLTPPDGRDFWTTPEEEGRPIFSAREVSTLFFGHPKLWLYRQIYAGNNVLDGQTIDIPRGPTQNKLLFQLGHVERLSHAFFQCGSISVKTFENSLLIVKSVASNYGLV